MSVGDLKLEELASKSLTVDIDNSESRGCRRVYVNCFKRLVLHRHVTLNLKKASANKSTEAF